MIQDTKRSALYAKLRRKERSLKSKEAKLGAHEKGLCESTAGSLRKKLKTARTEGKDETNAREEGF